MDLGEYVRSVLASWSEGEVVDTGPGEGEYRPPGHLARVVGDALAGLGTLGFLMPFLARTCPAGSSARRT